MKKSFYEFPYYNNVEKISSKIYQWVIEEKILERSIFFTEINFKKMLHDIPELFHAIQYLGLLPTKGYIVSIKPGFSADIHVDSKKFKLRILFPVYNCKNTFTRFHNVPKEFIKFVKNNNLTYYTITDPGPFDIIDEVELTTFTIINTQIPHSILKSNSALPDYRVSLTFEVENDLETYLSF
jgi:hypothetical protein